MMMMWVRHQGGYDLENDGPARRALLIFVFWPPALPNLLVSPSPTLHAPHYTYSQSEAVFLQEHQGSSSSFPPHCSHTLLKSLDQLWRPNENGLLVFGAIIAHLSTTKTMANTPSYQTW